MVYVDSSCLVALVAPEPRTPDVVNWLARHPRQRLCSSDWCVSEVASALSIKVRSGGLSTALADAAWSHFIDACDGLLQLVNVEHADFMLAAEQCRIADSGLRAGDALHLAIAQRLRCNSLWSFDRVLNLNARASGLQLVDSTPSDPSINPDL